jgi:hypothetical protein
MFVPAFHVARPLVGDTIIHMGCGTLMLVLMLKVLKDHPAFDKTLRKAFPSAMVHIHH